MDWAAGRMKRLCEDERWFALHGNTTTPASLEMANVSEGTANDSPLRCFIKYLLKKNTQRVLIAKLTDSGRCRWE